MQNLILLKYSLYRLTTMSASNPVFVPATCANQSLGISCNISSNPCSMAQPCLNLATCYQNSSLPLGYTCSCVQGFSGVSCEVDERVCRPDATCLNGGTCNETLNESTCICPTGKTGDHCEFEVDICANVSCKNNGQCVSNYGNWSCVCVNNNLYSGTYCQISSSALRTKEIISRSFGCIAIGCISAVVAFILIMDVLKYVFNIDPVDNELRAFRQRKYGYRERARRRQEAERKRKEQNLVQPVVAVRFQYVHA
jgi:hypothetical protein